METLIKHILTTILILSSVTVLTTLSLVLFQLVRRRPSRLLAVLSVLTGTLTAAGNVWLRYAGAEVNLPDSGKETITRFYGHLANREFPAAWALIHPARQEEVAKAGVHNAEDSGGTYATTLEYRRIDIELDHREPASRIYWVAFDVKDRDPKAYLYDYRWRPVKDAFEAGILNRKMVEDLVVQDVRQNFEVPEASATKIKSDICNRSLEFLFDPISVSEIARHEKLKPLESGPQTYVWTHRLQHVRAVDQDGWKIRSGLYPFTLIGLYPPGADLPQSPSKTR